MGIVGGCCGTTPEHIAAACSVVDSNAKTRATKTVSAPKSEGMEPAVTSPYSPVP